jgi:hypothetical protein
MGDLIQRLIAAIFRQEGMPADHTNPGNLRAAPWLKGTPYGVIIPMQGGFWLPPTRQQGVAGAAHVVSLHIAEGNTLRQLISIWAPPTDNNNTEAYIANVKNWAAIEDENVPLWTYIGIDQYSPSGKTVTG